MSDKVQLIKEEIERQIEEGKVKCQQSKENNDHESFVAWSEHVATCGKILLFINSIQEEPASEDLDRLVISLEETIGTSPHSREVIKEHLQRAAEWGRNHFENNSEIVSEDLEEAATKWNETASFQPFYMQLDCNGNPCEVKQDITTHKESFKAGAEWHKQQIIKDAVDGEYWDGSIYLDNRPTEYKDGDKVKIIIVKENGNHIKEEPTC